MSHLRIFKLKMQGASISHSSSISRLYYFWPHKIKIGKNCNIEQNCFFKHDGIYSKGKSIVIGNHVFIGNSVEFNIKEKIEIGSNTLIGAGSRFIDHDHGIHLGVLIKNQTCPTLPIKIEEDVWLGCNVVVLKGVTVGKGAVVAAGAIVNKNIDPYEIWAGVPARKIGMR